MSFIEDFASLHFYASGIAAVLYGTRDADGYVINMDANEAEQTFTLTFGPRPQVAEGPQREPRMGGRLPNSGDAIDYVVAHADADDDPWEDLDEDGDHISILAELDRLSVARGDNR